MTNRQTIAVNSNHHVYYVIARKNLEQGKAIRKTIDLNEEQYWQYERVHIEHYGRPDPEYIPTENARRIELLEKLCEHLTQAVVFAAMTAEAFINYYAVRKGTSSHFSKYFDNLTPMQKWLIIPAHFNNGCQLDPGKKPLQDLDYLVKLRNSLVHAKPEISIVLDDQGFQSASDWEKFYGPSVEEATRCVNTVKDLVATLHTIDNAVQTDWLDELGFQKEYFNLPKKI